MPAEFLDEFEKGIALSRERSRNRRDKRFEELWGAQP